MSKKTFSTRAALFASPVTSGAPKKSTFASRAAVFASPGDAVPKKKVAREKPLSAPVFEMDNDPEDVPAAPGSPKTPEAVEDVPEDSEDVLDDEEPMDVDTSNMPSPQKATPRRQAPATSAAQRSPSPPRGDTPCSKSTTPRRKSGRKSMPTPGKRLFFTSKDNEDEARKTDESTQLELLMANNQVEEMPQVVKDLLQDKKEMATYSAKLKREIEDIRAVKTSRETMLRQAEEVTSSAHVSSVTQKTIAPLDFSIRKEEKPEELVKRLFGSFLSITEEGGEMRQAGMEKEMVDRENEKLKNKLLQLVEIQKEADEHCAEMSLKYQEQQKGLAELDKKFEKLEQLKSRFQPTRMVFGF
ncbi:Protein CBR-KNL-3 [Caenorhabditis briggsae]|uniref:Protein CBR-KNL-3 n=2 Tax=Caenorhabditis briggsae TaxID=6238 RepID=A8Y0V7_CAEBR|nr:Protein CBR-KNL-3 [Caenorhabditis briggsae]UMM32584.1 hypothetical protein L5515_006323 [Caenorhabditis briggsae]CAP38527.2 Protein CBR-KNL-3 [Caenorhabditis briggsae]